MDEKQFKAILDRVIKTLVGLVTLKPIFRKWFSFKGLIITWIVLNIYWIFASLPFAYFDWEYMEFEFEEPEFGAYIDAFISILAFAVEIGVLLYLKNIYNFYVTGKTQQSLDLSKKLGVLSTAEYDVKLLSSKKMDYMLEVESMSKVGVFSKTQKAELIEMAEHYYSIKISEISIQQAYESGVLSKEERDEKLKNLTPQHNNKLNLDVSAGAAPPVS